MSFVFPSWETAFSPEFYESAKDTLETALNKGNKPPVIQGRIEVVELSMGTQPPTLTLLEIGDLSVDRFRGILRLGYQGDAWLEVRCRVQANPLSHNPNLASSSLLPLSTPLLASQPLLVPMTLRLSKLHLRAILILVVSASKGITLVFKNDPLQNVDVSSTFDSVEVIRGYLQQEIEGQLREMFREDLPGIIHRLSQRWLTGTGVGGRVEMPYRDGVVGSMDLGVGTPGKDDEPTTPSDPYAEKPIFPPYQPTPPLSQLTPKRRALAQMAAAARTRRPSTALSESPSAFTSLAGIEDYDPTYGLRPEGVPTHSGYEAFGRLWEKAREGGSGLGSLMRVPVGQQGLHEGDVSDEDGDVDASDEDVFGGIDHDRDSVEDVEAHEVLGALPSRGQGLARRTSGRSRLSRSTIPEEEQEWETYPAVGGGVITRPRVYHAQSQIRAPSEVGFSGALPSPGGTGGTGSITARASSVGTPTMGSMRRQHTGLRTPGLGGSLLPISQPRFQPRSQSQARLPTSTSASALAGPGPSSLRRMVTSRSDVFLSRPSEKTPFPTSLPASTSAPINRNTRRLSNAPSHPSNTNTNTNTTWSSADPHSQAHSTLPSSTSMSMSVLIPDTSSPSRSHLRTPSGSGPSSTSFPPRGSIIGPGGITLPLNNSVSQLAALSHEAQTLSPYARGHEHIAVRSFPHLGRSASGGPGRELGMSRISSEARGTMMSISQREGEQGRGKGNRKRTHRLGGGGGGQKEQELAGKGEGEVDEYMPLGAISPHFDNHRRLSPESGSGSGSGSGGVVGMGIGMGTYGLQALSMRERDRESTTGKGSMRESASLGGMASVLMANGAGPGMAATGAAGGGGGGAGLRPNLMRNPDSRSSYGFPQVRRYV